MKMLNMVKLLFQNIFLINKLNKIILQTESETESSFSDLCQSSGEEEEENYEQDKNSVNIDFSALDEKICPEDCNNELFRLAHDSRVQYHYLQGSLIENDAKIIKANQDIEKYLTRQIQLKEELKKVKEDLVLFRVRIYCLN